jgi:hypothetical protein
MIFARCTRRLWFLALLGVVAGAAAGGYFYWWASAGRPYDPPPVAFRGQSDQLGRTVVLPTLDSLIPDGKSAVWCGSFQLAWNRLRDDVARGPVRLDNAQAVADRLNRGDLSEDDLAPGTAFAAAGLAKDGIAGKVREEMVRRFPDAPAPDLDIAPDGAAAYAYLQAAAKFDLPFFDDDKPLLFTDSAGTATPVGVFGIRKNDDYAYGKLRGQVRVLFADRETAGRDKEVAEFAVDPCQTSQPYQIVLARVGRKATLAEALADVERWVAAGAAEREWLTSLHPRDTLLIPNMAWEVTHRFREVEGPDKRFANPGLEGLHLDAAMQTIRFRLDRSGAELSSESKVYVKPSASYFEFTRPFLLYMKKRDGGRPFFVMWVETAELLDRK